MVGNWEDGATEQIASCLSMVGRHLLAHFLPDTFDTLLGGDLVIMVQTLLVELEPRVLKKVARYVIMY